MLLSLCHCLWQSLFIFLPVPQEQQAPTDQKLQCWLVPCPLQAWWWPVWWYSTSPSFLQKMPCGLTGGHGTVGLVEMNGNGEWVPPVLHHSEIAGACWLHETVGHTILFLISISAQATSSSTKERIFFFNSKHLTGFKICGYTKTTWQLKKSVSLLQTRFIYSQIRRSRASVSPAVIWSARACCLKIA